MEEKKNRKKVVIALTLAAIAVLLVIIISLKAAFRDEGKPEAVAATEKKAELQNNSTEGIKKTVPKEAEKQTEKKNVKEASTEQTTGAPITGKNAVSIEGRADTQKGSGGYESTEQATANAEESTTANAERATTEEATTQEAAPERATTERATTERATTEETTTQESKPQACDHNWVAQTRTEKVLVEEAWDEEVWEDELRWKCSYCGKDVTGDDWHITTCGELVYDPRADEWFHEGAVATSYYKPKLVDTINHPAVYEDQTVVTGYKCSKCGATK